MSDWYEFKVTVTSYLTFPKDEMSYEEALKAANDPELIADIVRSDLEYTNFKAEVVPVTNA